MYPHGNYFSSIEPLIGGLRLFSAVISRVFIVVVAIEPLIGGLRLGKVCFLHATSKVPIEPLIGGLRHYSVMINIIPFWLLNPL